MSCSEEQVTVCFRCNIIPLSPFPLISAGSGFCLNNGAQQKEWAITTSTPRSDWNISPHVRILRAPLCVIMEPVWCDRRRRYQLTNGTQSNVAEDDDDENNTADHISAAPGERDNKEETFDMGEVRLQRNKIRVWESFSSFIHDISVILFHMWLPRSLCGIIRCHCIQYFQRDCSGAPLTF